ncbi:MAG: 50S ribosomal protein L19 [Acidobacteriota bacterium]|nr:50S ribosomal protein L19 [Acidobacteriota bacterium]
MNTMQLVEEKYMRKDLDPFAVGDTVKVHVLIKEGDKERVQIFQGDIIAKRGGAGMNASFTVRKISFGVGVERVFPLHSRSIKKIEVVRKTSVRRAKLYYLRSLKGKAARLRGDQR